MKNSRKIRTSHFPLMIFVTSFGFMLLIAGIHMGMVELFITFQVNSWISTICILLYWIFISAVFTLVTRYQILTSYEKPMRELAKATDQVAHGDFSVYVPTIHTPDHLDYLDVMIMDFNKMVEELGSIETLKTDFFSNVSHEIKTPLSVISNYAQLLQTQDHLTKEEQEYVSGIMQSCRKLADLITNILKLNRLEKQNIQPEVKVYDVCSQLCDCILQYETQWDEKNIELNVDVEDKAYIKCDPSLMEIVWNNLMSNALKFTEDGSKITVVQKSTEQQVIISVSDTGCGMERETMNHIFDKFYQGDTSHATEGNGLGLALVFRILQLSQGEISVDSTKEVGTTFTVSLPKANDFINQEGIE